ncbi:hypothetical protein HZC53_02770 [Candidatus Uhrbacteria bacterium]|nr:hypothetical protein [Candidatus Uhrbacteria bacterium]
MRNRFILSIINILVLCVVIFGVSSYFIYHSQFIGFVILGLGILCLVSLIPFRVSLESVWPDIVFGLIDNGILAVMAIFGGEIGGVIGAVIGGVVGNAITDGIAGIFEGWLAERNHKKSTGDGRTVLGSAVGKMSGCLLSAGVVLTFANILGL